MHGYNKSYFVDDTGHLFRDETGNLDWTDTIPMELELGRDNLASKNMKNYISAYFQSEQARTATVSYSIDGGNFKPLGQLEKYHKEFNFPVGQLGYDINFKIVHNDSGERPMINGPIVTFSNAER